MTKQHYELRNRQNLAKLADNTKIAANKLYDYCIQEGIQILIYETIRTKKQQEEYVKQKKSKTMRSYHLVGQALDFVLCDSKGVANWSGYHTKNADKVINYAKKLGFVSGRDWRWDSPHLQFEHKGYGTDTFGKKTTTQSTSKKTATNVKKATPKSLVDYLESKKMDSSFAARRKLAVKYGVKNYTGTAGQNMTLLAKIQKQLG